MQRKRAMAGRLQLGVLAVIGATILGSVIAVASASGSTATDQSAKATALANLDKANANQVSGAPKGTKPDDAQIQAILNAPCEAVTWEEGVSDTQESMLPVGVAEVTSVWMTTVGQSHYAVYAGSVDSDHSQGLLIVQAFDACGRHVSDTSYAGAAKLGELHIASVTGHVLSLTGPAGDTITFDFDARTFK